MWLDSCVDSLQALRLLIGAGSVAVTPYVCYQSRVREQSGCRGHDVERQQHSDKNFAIRAQPRGPRTDTLNSAHSS